MMDQKFQSLLRFVIFGLAAAGHHFALTPPTSASPEERDIVDSFVNEKGAGATDEGDDGSTKKNTDIIHENIAGLRLGMKLCNWSRYCVWIIVALEGTTRALSLFPTSGLSTTVLPVIFPSFSAMQPHIKNPFFALESGLNRPFLLSAAVVISGAVIRGLCFRTMKRLYTFSHTTLSEHTLVKTGPYAIVRHPGYLGTVLVRSGMTCLLFSPGSLANTSGGMFSTALRVGLGLYASYSISEQTWLLARSWREDETLRRKFSVEWEEYRKKVPYRFIPYII